MTNQARRVQAEQALSVYLHSKGQRHNSVTFFEDAVDLLADILHLALHKGVDTDKLLRVAESRFQAEVNDHDDD